MTDPFFIEQIIQQGQEAKRKVQHELSGLSYTQLNWKSSEKVWSTGQCLQHLIIADKCYFDDLKKIAEGKYKMNFWEKYSPFSKLCGRIMKNQLQAEVKAKLKAPEKIQPMTSNVSTGILDDYYTSLDNFLRLILACSNADIDKIKITSPFIKFVTYSVRDAFQFLIQHEHRHINQAIRVKASRGFPK